MTSLIVLSSVIRSIITCEEIETHVPSVLRALRVHSSYMYVSFVRLERFNHKIENVSLPDGSVNHEILMRFPDALLSKITFSILTHILFVSQVQKTICKHSPAVARRRRKILRVDGHELWFLQWKSFNLDSQIVTLQQILTIQKYKTSEVLRKKSEYIRILKKN